MDKQQILQTAYASKVANWEKVFRQNPSIIESAYESMDIHAKEVAIEFAEFILCDYYMSEFTDGRTDDLCWSPSNEQNDIKYTTEQLYELFLQSKNESHEQSKEA